ncbi:cyclin-U2-1-like [Ananas comosus]|uniref:Cyclin-U2-1 n=1 Tax=Ananas comosus TaxID=4615 RepID=A0A199UT80_ANACO|nr:cyclin-U2-1-like [Ananas comosus]OAY68017.1 Cyclin-U2-1 [Ananas comosus]
MGSDIISISPTRLRSDLYGFAADDAAPRTPLVISVLASLLERAIARSERRGGGDAGSDDARARVFECDRVLDMSISSFLERIFRYARVSPPIYVVAYVYMDRLCRSNPGFRIVSTNVHRILTTSIMVASKFVEDMNYPNSYFAKIGGLETQELNGLEVELLFLMGFKLNVSVSVFESYCRHLEREVSFGGGYQIERWLMKARIMCGGEMITSRERNTTTASSGELNQLARVP